MLFVTVAALILIVGLTLTVYGLSNGDYPVRVFGLLVLLVGFGASLVLSRFIDDDLRRNGAILLLTLLMLLCLLGFKRVRPWQRSRPSRVKLTSEAFRTSDGVKIVG